MIEELSNRIWNNKKFHDDLRVLQAVQLKKFFGLDYEPLHQENDILRRLFSSAVTLSASSNQQYKKVAYEIATAGTDFCADRLPGTAYALLLVLNRLGNFPALDFAQKKFSIDESALPTQTLAETDIRKDINTIKIGEKEISLTDFQLDLWNSLSKFSTVSISAPTSAGKSFILQLFAEQCFERKEIKNAAIVVPSRALITQVSSDVAKWNIAQTNNLEIVTTPISSDAKLPKNAIYVVTQERLQLLLTAHPNLHLDLLLIDEAQGLSEGPRGVLLTSVIDRCLRRYEKTQLIFAGPNLSNPERLSLSFDRKSKVVKTTEPTVTQQIFLVSSSEETPNSIDVSLKTETTPVKLGSLEVDQPLFDHKSKLINIPMALGKAGQSLVYALGPSECESIAFGIADFDGYESSDEQRELSVLAKETVHPKFQLSQGVLQGVGYHYGRLPSLLRKAVEDAFSQGHIDFLVTTSTLLQGVNLPARNLFLHNPHRGQHKPVSSVDFWNLAGRAGRLGKEFSGNIFLIDYGEWESDPMAGEKEKEVIPAFEDHIVNQTVDLIEYIGSPLIKPSFQEQDEFENTFSKLVQDHLSGNIETTLDRVGLVTNDPNRVNLLNSISDAVRSVDMDEETINNSPTVSIHRQQSLLDRLQKSLEKKGPQYIVPKHPKSRDAYSSYVAVMIRCHQEILKLPKTDKSHKYFVQLILKWMRGDPIPKIIDGNFSYLEKVGKKPKMASVIRTTLSEIENDIRFKYVRLFSCYNTVLEFVLRRNGHSDIIPSIPSLPLYLEMGACSTTMMNLMGLGVSRFTAVKIQNVARRQDMGLEDVRKWIERQDIDSLDIPQACIGEIRRVFTK